MLRELQKLPAEQPNPTKPPRYTNLEAARYIVINALSCIELNQNSKQSLELARAYLLQIQGLLENPDAANLNGPLGVIDTG